MTKHIVDQEARDKIKHVLHQNFLVEAGEGSGKTTSLVDRMVNLIYTGTCRIHEMVAITFTRKAADELKIRFQSELEKKWKSETDDRLKQQLEEALQNIEQCFLGTVHSFCARLLRERPVEAKLDVTFSELEDDEDQLVAEEAWVLHVQKLQLNDTERLQAISELGLDLNKVKERFQYMKRYPDVEWVKEDIAKPDLSGTH
jgi:ATP-dependent helicase/nuclease subunit A